MGCSSENDGSWKVEATDVDEIELGYDEEGDEDEIKDGGIKDEDDDIKDEDITATVPRKCTANLVTKKTGACPGNSNPVRSDSKKLKVTNKFAEIANTKEVTVQKPSSCRKLNPRQHREDQGKSRCTDAKGLVEGRGAHDGEKAGARVSHGPT
jgi:hypothetical protein